MTLEHRNWEVLDERGSESRNHYNKGWVRVFEVCYGGACRKEMSA